MSFQDIQMQQAEFMDACGQERFPLHTYTDGEDTGITEEIKSKAIAGMWLYRNLIAEEVNTELIAEIDNFRAYVKQTNDANMSVSKLTLIADGAIDSIVVILGLLNTMGIDGNEVWEVVHQANMNKRNKDGKVIKRPDGKILKPRDWKPADVEYIIELGVATSRREAHGQ